MNAQVFTSFYPFGGLGAGARGFLQALARLGPDAARFKVLGGIDNDADACRDFKLLTGADEMHADIRKVTPKMLLDWLAERHGREAALRRPDCVFTSPPCKGFSRLLGNKKAQEKKYRELNELVYVGLFLMCETWSAPPPLIVLENVPGIISRGAEILDKAQGMLSRYGYVFHRATHDCGEIGGLAQHRKRFLLVARHQKQCSAYVYQPPRLRVRACGEVLEELPIPGGDEGGELHVLPGISWLNWVRLALIPAGGDWRDLPKAIATQPNNPNAHENKHAVGLWSEPAPTVIGATRPGSGAPSVADPRPFDGGRMGVQSWDSPAKTVTGESYPSNGSASVADPRLAEAVELGATAKGSEKFKGSPGLFGVIDWQEPSPAVTGSASVSGSNGKAAVADPRIALTRAKPFGNINHVTPWAEPVGAVVASPAPSSGAPAVADPRVPPLAISDPTRGGALGVLDWSEPAPTITGNIRPASSNTPGSIADPRLPAELLSPVEEGAQRRSEFPKYDVRPWDEPARTVAGSGTNGGFAVADPRVAVNHRDGRHTNQMKVQRWEEPARTVTGDTDIQAGAQLVADPRVRPETGHHGSYGVRPWSEPAAAVTTGGHPSCGPNSVADPRIELGHSPNRGTLGVQDWSEPAKTVRGRSDIRTGPAAVADPRISEVMTDGSGADAGSSDQAVLEPSAEDRRLLELAGDEVGPGIRSHRSTGEGVAEAHLRAPLRVGDHAGPDSEGAERSARLRQPVVRQTGAGAPSSRNAGPEHVGDGDTRSRSLGVEEAEHETQQQAGDGDPSLQRPRRRPREAIRRLAANDLRHSEISNAQLSCAPRNGSYGILSWREAAATITGSASIDNGSVAVADPRKPPNFIPVIIAADGTWHRPLTTLELAALQGLPTVLDGKPLKLSGKKIASWRERIGNAVPVQAGTAIATSLLKALLASALGTWFLSPSGEPIWVRQDGRPETDFSEYELGEASPS